MDRLREESPGALVAYPAPESERREQRIRIELAAWATDIAATVAAKYRDLVDLRVGAMTFPARELLVSEHTHQLRGAPADTSRARRGTPVSVVGPDRPAHARGVLVTNRAAHRHLLFTNGDLPSAVTDSSGSVSWSRVSARTRRRGCSSGSNPTEPPCARIDRHSLGGSRPGVRSRPARTMVVGHRATDRQRQHAVGAAGDHHHPVSSTRSAIQRRTRRCSPPTWIQPRNALTGRRSYDPPTDPRHMSAT